MANYDLSGIPLLQATLDQMAADQATSPSLFVGGANFTASYTRVPTGTSAGPGATPATGPTALRPQTTSTLWQDLNDLVARAQRLAR